MCIRDRAMLEMGFINYGVVTKVIAEQLGTRVNVPSHQSTPQPVFSNGNTPGSTPMNNNAPLNSFTAAPAPIQQPQPQQPVAPPPMMFNAPPAAGFGFSPPSNGVPFMPGPMPIANGGPRINFVKLSALPQKQQEMIKQVLQLPADQIRLLPSDQIAMVENFKREYLM